MKHAIEAAALIALISATFLCVELARAVHSFNVSLPETQKQISGLLTDVDRTTIIIAGTATNIEKASREWKDQSLSQSQAATIATRQLNSDLQGLGALLSTANSTLLMQSKSLSNLETQVGKSIGDTLAQTSPSLTNLSNASRSLSEQLPPILSNLSDTSAQTVLIAKNTADTTASVDASAHDIQAFIHRETTPVRGTWNVIRGFLMEFAGPAAQVATAAK